MVLRAQKDIGRRDQRAELELITPHEHESERASKRHSERQRPVSHGGGSSIVSPNAATSRPSPRNSTLNANESSLVMGPSGLILPHPLQAAETLWPSHPSSPQEEPSYTYATPGKNCYTCETCGKMFALLSQLRRHQLDHEKPEICMICDKRFPTRSELRRHIQSVHESAKRFYCKVEPCKYNKTGAQENGTYFGNDMCFGRPAAIRRHLREVHKLTNDVETWFEVENREEPVENLAEKLLSAQIEHPYGSNSYFIPINELYELLNKRNILQELRKTFPTMEEQRLESYANRIYPSARKLFAVLVCTSSGIQGSQIRAIYNFIEEGVTDTDLPFERLYTRGEPANPSSRSNTTYTLAKASHSSCTFSNHKSCGINAVSSWSRIEVQNLCRDQWLVLAPIFEGTPGTAPLDLCFQDGVVLPFIEDWETDSEEVKFGGYSEVWPVRIHPAHQKLLRPKSHSGPEPRIAVKRLYSRNREDFQRERDMLSQLTLKNHRHLARLLITYTLKDRFHLLCPFAKSNLRDYWKRNKQPMDRDSYLWTLQQISGLASALNQIHNFSLEATSREETVGPIVVNPVISRERPSMNVELRVDPGEKYGRHGDLKPENILWFDDLEGVEEAGVLQITDFGLGRFHRLESRSKQDPKAMNGSPTYSPPELPLGKYVNRGYDIWSFGCIFLEFITWIIYGYDGLEDFAEARTAVAHDGILDDTYYMLIVSTSERGAVVREEVINWIAQLRREPRCSEMIGDLLDLVQQHMLRVDSKDRIQCKELDSKLKSMLEAAEANTFYLLGNITTTTIAKKSNSNSTKNTSTEPSKRNLTLTDRSKSQQRKRR